MRYADFLARKLEHAPPTGLADVPELSTALFPFQRDLTAWALRRGRAAIFADTGLGKTRMELEWARHVPGDVLVLAPLAVAAQTAREGTKIGVPVTVCREPDDVRPGINVTNYDRLHKFDPDRFAGVVLDESSCIKHHTAKTLAALLDAFARTPFKLCATATPAPNDYTELGNHAEFLGVCTRTEMLAEFFVHDGGETQVWRLKGHARQAFWRWVTSWGAFVRKPSDLGYDDSAYLLPPLDVEQHVIPADQATVFATGNLFAVQAGDLMERKRARRASITKRVAECAAIVNAEKSEPWVVWCALNDESDALAEAIPGAVEIRGSMTTDEKEDALARFADGRARVIISKASITGWGLNWQHCARMAFVGVDDSWESYYQAVRRCYRFGQTRPVEVHIFASEAEGSVIDNLARKERDAAEMAKQLSAETASMVRAQVVGTSRETNPYCPEVEMEIPGWLMEEAA